MIYQTKPQNPQAAAHFVIHQGWMDAFSCVKLLCSNSQQSLPEKQIPFLGVQSMADKSVVWQRV